MKWITFNIIGLLCALAVFGTSATFAAANVQEVVQSELSSIDTDDFMNNSDLSIGDLLEQSGETALPETTNRNPVLRVAAEGQADAKVIITSSAPVSSKPVSSAKTSSKQASSEQVSSEAPSSRPVSSDPVKTVAASAETVSSSDMTYSEIITGEVPSSQPVSDDQPLNESTLQTPETAPPVADVDEEILMIVSGAVQREMIGANSPPREPYYEAYKAQAVASHTYMEYYKQANGAYPQMSYAAPHEKTIELVRSVLNRVMYYNGALINASYHAASGGATQSAGYVWTGTIPYLLAAESRYDDYVSSYTLSVSEASAKLANAGITASGDPSTWFDLSTATISDGGFVDYMPICGTMVKGRTLRENIFGSNNLKSCKITSISTSGDSITFNTKGYGHGAGMSQQGAMGLSANEGYSYSSILTHYYAGIEIRG